MLKLEAVSIQTFDVRRPFTLRMLASQGVTMALFPLHFFFTALYYTDTGSTLLVIGAHLLALRRAYLAAGLAAAAATAFRQTNAVWAAFTLAVRRSAMRRCPAVCGSLIFEARWTDFGGLSTTGCEIQSHNAA
jgi:hypothetical protein